MTEKEHLPEHPDRSQPTEATRDEPKDTGPDAQSPSPASSTPRQLGRFRIKRVIGSGGMGTVYEAQQEQPRRTVALKVMKAGVASRSALRRFEYESQILARLRHPGIAQVYDAGTQVEDGVSIPWFAMEYIPNARTLTDFATLKALSTSSRLELFAGVCDAVHHGHQKGIIHRDLKPGNILVDPAGQPKIIDFGVARSTDSDLAVTTLQTDIGQLIGTLQYMSPEQVDADPHDLDVRSDVYSLGVVLFELLTGQRPYDIGSTGIIEATRMIRERAPARMRTITGNAELAGDIETITFKALEKDRARRYQSALELKQDLERFLRREPISARPASVAYQIRVFARRHKALVGASIAIVVGLLVGVIGLSIGLLRAQEATHHANRQRQLAVDAEAEARLQAQRADAARAEAELQAANARAAATFFRDMLASVDPARGATPAGGGFADAGVGSGRTARDVSVSDLLVRASKVVDQSFATRPALGAEMRDAIGTTFFGLGMLVEAEQQLNHALAVRRELLGGDHPDTLRTIDQLGELYVWAGRFGEAESLLRPIVPVMEEALGASDRQTLRTMRNLAMAIGSQGRMSEALAELDHVLAMQRTHLGPSDRDTLGTMLAMASGLTVEGRGEEAESITREALALIETSHGADDYLYAWGLGRLAMALYAQGDVSASTRVQRKCLDVHMRSLGPEHDNTLFAGATLYELMLLDGEPEELIALCEEMIATMVRESGTFKADTMAWRARLVEAFIRTGRSEDARMSGRQLIRDASIWVPENSERSVHALNEMAWRLREDTDLLEGAIAHSRRSIELATRLLGAEHVQTLNNADTLAVLLHAAGRIDEAVEVLDQVVRASHAGMASSMPVRWQWQTHLADLLIEQKSFAQAEPLLLEAHERLVATIGPSMNWSISAGESLVALYEAWGRPEDADNWRGELERARASGGVP